MTKIQLSHTIYHKLKDGTELQVPAFEDELTGEIVSSSAWRQPKKGAKVHGGHCCICNKELDRETRESYRGVCNDCAKDDPRWSL